MFWKRSEVSRILGVNYGNLTYHLRLGHIPLADFDPSQQRCLSRDHIRVIAEYFRVPVPVGALEVSAT